MSNVFDGYRLRESVVTLCSRRQDSWIFDRQSSSARRSRREAERLEESIALSMTKASNSWTRRVRASQRVRRLAVGQIAGTRASLDCAWVGRTEKEGRDDEICNWKGCQRHIQGSACDDDRPFGKGVEWFVFGSRDDSHLIAAHGVDQPSTLDDCLRTHKDEVNLVHDVCHGRVEHDRTRDACSRQRFVRLDPDMTM